MGVVCGVGVVCWVMPVMGFVCEVVVCGVMGVVCGVVEVAVGGTMLRGVEIATLTATVAEGDWHTSLKDWQQGKDELAERQETSQAQIAVIELTPEAIAFPQLLGRQVGKGATGAGPTGAEATTGVGATTGGLGEGLR